MAALAQAVLFVAFLALIAIVSFGAGYGYHLRKDCTDRGGQSVSVEGYFVCAASITPIPHTPA